MVKRLVGKTIGSKRYKQLKAVLIHVGHNGTEITSRNFASHVDGGIFSESSARNWLEVFFIDGLISIVRREVGGRKVYKLNCDETVAITRCE